MNNENENKNTFEETTSQEVASNTEAEEVISQEVPQVTPEEPAKETEEPAPTAQPTYQIFVDPRTGKYSYPGKTPQTPMPPVTPASQNPVYTHSQPPQYNYPQSPQYGYQQPQYGYQQPPQRPAQNFQNPQVNPVYTAQPVVPQKKKSTASKVFMIILFVLLGIFSIGFFLVCGYFISDNRTGSPSQNNDSSQAPEYYQAPNGSTVIPNDDNELYSDDTKITLNPLPKDKVDTTKYTTQYAYNAISVSTVGVVCYSDTSFSAVQSQGTGIVISGDGYIVTNSHVIGDSATLYQIRVTTEDGTTYEARIIGYDSRTDLAVLKVNGENMKAATFSSSDDAYIGQDVIAVGNPGGMDFQNSLTKGIISAKDRKLNLSSQVSFLQTDAAINPGNSGGPLCNLQGQVIGVTSAKIASEDFEGMGFAIPSTTVKEVVDDLIAHGYVEGRVRIGITGQAITEAMTQYYDLPSGIIVSEIDEDGPCADTELQADDIITHFDGKPVASFSDIYEYLSEHKAGDEVTLTVYRDSENETFDIDIVLAPDTPTE